MRRQLNSPVLLFWICIDKMMIIDIVPITVLMPVLPHYFRTYRRKPKKNLRKPSQWTGLALSGLWSTVIQ